MSFGEIEYNQEEYLNLGASYPETDQNLKTEFHIINIKEDKEEIEEEAEEVEERIEDIELEARFVAKKIKEYWDKGYLISSLEYGGGVNSSALCQRQKKVPALVNQDL